MTGKQGYILDGIGIGCLATGHRRPRLISYCSLSCCVFSFITSSGTFFYTSTSRSNGEVVYDSLALLAGAYFEEMVTLKLGTRSHF